MRLKRKRSERRMARPNNYAWIMIDDREVTECRLVDISRMGARLVVVKSFAFPATFGVATVSRGTARPAALVWRNAVMVGVRFLD